jgi:hypothetical protein
MSPSAFPTGPPREVFAPWPDAHDVARRLAREPIPAPWALRSTGFLPASTAERIAAWFGGRPVPATPRVRAAYQALEAETGALFGVVCAARRAGGLGVRVRYVGGDDPYAAATQLCAELRGQGTMCLRTIASTEPHPLLDSTEGGPVDQLRVVHDVFGHAALGVGFDLQSEYATWLQCRALFGPLARHAAFTELVGAVTAFVAAGAPPPLRADLAPGALMDARRARHDASTRQPRLRRSA